MGRTDWTAIAIGGTVLVVGAYAWINWKTVCPQVFGAGSTACASDTPLEAVVTEFNKLPTLLQNPSTNQYRSVTMDTEDPKVVSKRIQDQSDFSNPKTAAAVKTYVNTANKNAGTPAGGTSGKNGTGYNCNSTLCKLYPSNCPGCKKSNYTFNSFATITLNRMSVR